jgi:hypothetical protein
MVFETRIYIQGVGIYVPHSERAELLVLFPDSEVATKNGVRDSDGHPICKHHAVVQFDACDLAGNRPPEHFPEIWTTLDVSGCWVGFSTDTNPPFKLAGGNGVPGVPHLPSLLSAAEVNHSAAFDQRTWPHQQEAKLLRAGLHLNSGILSPYAQYEGLFRFGTRRSAAADQRLASVLKLELGSVEEFALLFRPFGSASPPHEVRFDPRHDELEIWVRHFCDLAKPDLDAQLPLPDEADVDFALNYALLDQLQGLLSKLDSRLPVPSVSPSWIGGGHIGLEPRKCNGSGTGSYSYRSPFS